MPTRVVILAGGRGTRIGEETELRPKPMVEIGGRPILWHIMSIYAAHGLTDFVVCLGYKGFLIKEYFANYLLHNSNLSVDLKTGSMTWHAKPAEDWRITLVDTGGDTMTGGRLKRVKDYLDPDSPFCLTYGDGLANVDIGAELAFHRSHGNWATMTVVPAPPRFGNAQLTGDRVVRFLEKPASESGDINGGFFVLSPKVLDLIEGDSTVWEGGPLEKLASLGQLRAWRHTGFWQPMDTPRERDELRALWDTGRAPWRQQ